MTRALVTGGAGFIGSAFVRHTVLDLGWDVLNVDKLTYAGNLENLTLVAGKKNYRFLLADICDRAAMCRAFSGFSPDVVINLAAESHVDRSIASAEDFIQTNILGTYRLLECAVDYFKTLPEGMQKKFRFHQVSTDEVYGALGDEGAFTESTAYDPSSPYSASKASADHLVRAWGRTFGLPVSLSNCSNNYGPYQYPEKLIPLMIANALAGKPLPVYGTGKNVRDWLYVDDHVRGIVKIVTDGKSGQTYNIGGNAEWTNIDIVRLICRKLDVLCPRRGGRKYEEMITFVADRPGHDFRYAIDCAKIRRDFDWKPQESFESGIEKTIQWYVNNQNWCRQALAHNADIKKTAKG